MCTQRHVLYSSCCTRTEVVSQLWCVCEERALFTQVVLKKKTRYVLRGSGRAVPDLSHWGVAQIVYSPVGGIFGGYGRRVRTVRDGLWPRMATEWG